MRQVGELKNIVPQHVDLSGLRTPGNSLWMTIDTAHRPKGRPWRPEHLENRGVPTPLLLSAQTPQAIHDKIELRQQHLTNTANRSSFCATPRGCNQPRHQPRPLRPRLLTPLSIRAEGLHTLPQHKNANHSTNHPSTLLRQHLSSQPPLALAPVRIYPILLNPPVNNRRLRHDKTVNKNPAELAPPYLGLQTCESGTTCGGAEGSRHLRPEAREAAHMVMRAAVRAWPLEWVVGWVEWHFLLGQMEGAGASVTGEGSVRSCLDEDELLGNLSLLDWLAGGSAGRFGLCSAPPQVCCIGCGLQRLGSVSSA